MMAEMLEESFMAEAYIVAAVRTAGGRRGGRLSGWHPADLAAQVIDAWSSAPTPTRIWWKRDHGLRAQAGEQATNRSHGGTGFATSESGSRMTIDRQCGSSQQALHFAAQAVMSGAMDMSSPPAWRACLGFRCRRCRGFTRTPVWVTT